MVKQGPWKTDEDDIAENWDNDPTFASRPLLYNKHTKTASVRLLALSLLLDRSPSGTYQRILKLRKSPAERMRLAQIHKDSNARGNPIRQLEPYHEPYQQPYQRRQAPRGGHDRESSARDSPWPLSALRGLACCQRHQETSF
jgi:hypothetical protein